MSSTANTSGEELGLAAADARTGSGPTWTPGPWVTVETGFGETRYLVCRDQPGRIHPVCVTEQDDANALANAQLIAAAPDLYEALRDLLLLEGGRFGTGVIKPGTYGAAVINAARDAIARAEGQPQ